MKVIDLYNKLQNPLDNNKEIEKLINLYLKSNSMQEYYKKMITKDYNTKPTYLKSEIDEFYCTIFNVWKENIIKLSFKRFSNITKNEKLENDFSRMREFLEKIPEVKTKEEINNIIFGQYKEKTDEIAETLKLYYWDTLPNSNWEYVSSRLITLKRLEEPNVQHNLYININNEHIYGFAKKLFEKCTEFDIPYYFKFNKLGIFNESIIINTDSKYIMYYIRILDEIKNKYPEYVAGNKNDSYLTGRMSSWLGYAEEPIDEESSKKNYPFYWLRAKCIYDVIDNYFINLVKQNIDNEYMNDNTANLLIRNLENKNLKVDSEIIESINENMSELLNDFCENSLSGIDIIDEDESRTIFLSKEEIKDCIKESAYAFAKEDINLCDLIRNGIISNFEKNDIDINKVCFNKSTFKE